MPSDMKTTVPRIKETDIQVMNDVVGKGKFGNVNRGFVKKGTRNTEVAFKTLRGKGLFTPSVRGSASVNAWKDSLLIYLLYHSYLTSVVMRALTLENEFQTDFKASVLEAMLKLTLGLNRA